MNIFAGSPRATTQASNTPSASRTAPSMAASESTGDPEAVSSIGADVKIVGKVISEGVVNIFGRVEGELRASSALIGDAAHFDGKIVTQELVIRGHVKGTIHATRVKLEGSAVVQGDIFHRSLVIEENAQFDGQSRPQENLTEAPSTIENEMPKLQPQAESIEA
jgi:cytoskeletal protein CcmA (bactofilin family)